MSDLTGWSKIEHAKVVRQLIKPGSYVNLGIGMPGLISSLITDEDGIYLHCENGLTGYRDLREGETKNSHIIDAASKPVALIPGASVVAHDISFAIARGGRLDATILGAYQVDSEGSFANWKTPESKIAGVGGAMDLAVGAKEVIIMMKHRGKHGEPKILERCTYPLTAQKVVKYVVTEFACLEVREGAFFVQQLAPGINKEDLQSITEAKLKFHQSVNK